MAFSPAGELYGIGGLSTGPSELYLIDIDLASPSETIDIDWIGTVSSGGVDLRLNALEFRPDGTMFGASWNPFEANYLYSIDPGTGAATEEMDIGFDTSAGDLVFAEDGNMYITSSGGDLLEIDPALTSVDVVGPTGFGDFFGMTYGPGPEMYGFRMNREVYYINRDDASITPLVILDHPQLDFIYGAANLYQPPTDLGELDFAELTGEEPIVEELWYRLEPTRSGRAQRPGDRRRPGGRRRDDPLHAPQRRHAPHPYPRATIASTTGPPTPARSTSSKW